MLAKSLRLAAAAAVGTSLALAGASATAAPWGWFGGEDQAPPARSYGMPAPEPNWAEKIVAPLSMDYWRDEPAQRPAAPPTYKNDPLALATPTGPPTPAMYVAMADLADRGGNSEESRRLYHRALEMDARCGVAALKLARLEDRLGRMPEALAAYRRAAAIEPKNPTVLNDLALCLARQAHLGESYQLMRTAINLQPQKPLYRNNMAKILIEMNRHDEAMANLRTVASPAVANYNMGYLLVQRGRGADAKRYLSAALALEPRMDPARALMAQLTPPTGTRPMVASQTPVQSPTQSQPVSQPVMQTARRPQQPTMTAQQPFIMPQEPWSPPTSAAEVSGAPEVDDSILPTPTESNGGYPTTGGYPAPAMPAVEAAPAGDAGPSLLPAIGG